MQTAGDSIRWDGCTTKCAHFGKRPSRTLVFQKNSRLGVMKYYQAKMKSVRLCSAGISSGRRLAFRSLVPGAHAPPAQRLEPALLPSGPAAGAKATLRWLEPAPPLCRSAPVSGAPAAPLRLIDESPAASLRIIDEAPAPIQADLTINTSVKTERKSFYGSSKLRQMGKILRTSMKSRTWWRGRRGWPAGGERRQWTGTAEVMTMEAVTVE
jgi:hypothetical protein